MYIINKIFNLEKKKISSKIKITKNFKKNFKLKYKNYILKIYITGGGCYGFKYGFCLEKIIKKSEIIIQKDFIIIIDKLSYVYILNSKIDYHKNINNSKFVIKNPYITNTCSCGSSFKLN